MKKFTSSKFLFVFFVALSPFFNTGVWAQHVPIPVTGFNQDVVAEGIGTSSLATTTREMDAITPSNFVMCTKQFANANAITPANTYGLPDNGTLVSGTKSYQFAPFTGNNALYLYTTENGTLTLTTPGRYTNISILILATENNSTNTVTFNFTDGTTQIATGQVFYDWFGTATTGIAGSGYGRIKRKAGPFVAAADYEGAAAGNPKLFSLEFALPCAKTLASINFRNTTSTVLTASNRSFIFAVSGVVGSVPAAPAANPVTLCSAGSASLSIVNPVAGVNYTWFAAPTGGFASGTGVTFNTPSLSANTTYYILATNATSGCTSDPRVPVTVTIGTLPAAPAVNPISICPNNTGTLSITNPVTGITYNWYAAVTGGTSLSTGTTYTTPTVTASTTYYVEAVNAAGCASAPRVPVVVTVGTRPAAPTANPVSVCPNNTATLAVIAPVAGIGYNWYAAVTGGTSLSTGTTYTTPTVTASTTYYVEAVNAAGCTSTPRVPVVVTVGTQPAAPTVDPVSVCPNNTANLAVTNPVTGITYNWYAAATGGTILATGTTYTTPVVTASTTYYVEAVNTGGCTSTSRTAVVIIFLPKLPAPVAQATTIGVNSVTFTWTAVTGANGYQVSVNNGAYMTPSSGNLGLIHIATGLQPLSTVTFKVKALGPQSCQNSDSATASAKTLSDEIYIPNSFTPNGDGHNDIFKAYGNIIASIDMKIFNQWGQMIFASTDFSLGWNGVYNGKKQPVGVYIYIMSLKLIDGTTVTRKGDINLIR